MKQPDELTPSSSKSPPDMGGGGWHVPEPRAGARASGSRWPDIAAVGFLLLCGLINTVMAVRAPPQVGFTEDDGIYLTTARALADGRGYRHFSLPGEPYQTKYPILYPLSLAVVWRAFPGFPENVVAAQVMNGVHLGPDALRRAPVPVGVHRTGMDLAL
jgi:hypothetical protein